MSYIKQTIKYVFSNFWQLIFFVIIPIVFFGLVLDVDNFINFIEKIFFEGGKIDFFEMFTFFSFLNFDGWFNSIFSVVFFISSVICLCFTQSYIDMTMRIGIRSFKGAFSHFNDNIFSTAIVLFLFFAVYELLMLLFCGLAVLIQFLFIPFSRILVVLLCLLVFIVIFFFIFLIMELVLLWLPCMQVNGFGFYESLVYSNTILSSNRKNMVIGLIVPYTIVCAIVFLTALFIPNIIINYVVILAGALLLFMYYPVYMYVVYFDKAGIAREDTKPKFINED